MGLENKYRFHIYKDVKEWFLENDGREITDEEIDDMSKRDVLEYYLQWNGIFGYTSDIVSIMEAR